MGSECDHASPLEPYVEQSAANNPAMRRIIYIP